VADTWQCTPHVSSFSLLSSLSPLIFPLSYMPPPLEVGAGVGGGGGGVLPPRAATVVSLRWARPHLAPHHTDPQQPRKKGHCGWRGVQHPSAKVVGSSSTTATASSQLKSLHQLCRCPPKLPELDLPSARGMPMMPNLARHRTSTNDPDPQSRWMDHSYNDDVTKHVKLSRIQRRCTPSPALECDYPIRDNSVLSPKPLHLVIR
jgi:hypothetical protein